MSESLGDARQGTDDVAPAPDGDIPLQAQFWHSPFAMAAATVVVSQFMILASATWSGRDVPFEILSGLTALAAVMLAAGIWPSLNYLSIRRERIEQKVGLTSVQVDWDNVTAVTQNGLSVDMRYVEGTEDGAAQARHARIFNRYDVPMDEFTGLIEAAWERHAQR